MQGTGYVWHGWPDGGATYPAPDGGWVYVSNSELDGTNGGASAIRQCLDAELCDELHIDIVSVLLGDGLRLFENFDAAKVRLERISVEAATAVRTSLRFRVVGQG